MEDENTILPENGVIAISPSIDKSDGVSTQTGPIRKWYVLRSIYGQEKKAYEYLAQHGIRVYLPTVKRVKLIRGKRVTRIESRLLNLFFAYGTLEELQLYVYDNYHEETKSLRFYSEHSHFVQQHTPLSVPESQMQQLMLVCNQADADVRVLPNGVSKFQAGQLVRVVNGQFKGVEGRVARWHGQQRVALVIDGLCTLATAYVPSAFLQLIEENPNNREF